MLIFVAYLPNFRIAVAAVRSLVHLVQEGNHDAKNGDRHDQLDDATDKEQHSGLCGREGTVLFSGSRTERTGWGWASRPAACSYAPL